jgi:glycosyltransferase involved in cell wall biosynthesis
VKLLVVIPAYNEEQALPSLLTELREEIVRLGIEGELLVVDDGSVDKTAERAGIGGARVVRLCRNLGIGGAVQTGLRVALREGFDCAVQVDGDGQHPASELQKLLSTQTDGSRADLVVGTRFIDKNGFRSTALRRLGAWWLRVLLRILGLKVTDPTSGFRLYARRALVLFNQNYPYDYPEPEALAIARAAGLRVAEVPVQMRERQGGTSSISGLWAPYYMLKVTLAVLLAYIRNRSRTLGEETNA